VGKVCIKWECASSGELGYIHEINKFKPLFNIPLTKYNALNEYPPSDEIK
jgi:hypothetical protein